MHKRPGPKRKSQKRFEQLNLLVDRVIGQLPTSTHMVATLVFFRHAGPGGTFRLSARRLGETIAVTTRHAKRLFNELEHHGAVRLIEERQVTIPRRYQITGTVRSGDTHVTPYRTEHYEPHRGGRWPTWSPLSRWPKACFGQSRKTSTNSR